MGWLANAAIREARLLKKLLRLASYAIDVDGNVTGFVDANGDPVDIDDSVADWTALQAIPKVAANDKIVILVTSANRLMRLNYALGQWQAVDSHLDDSIMWMGDSLTAQSGVSCHPLLAANTPYYAASVTSLTNLGPSGANFITAARCDPGCSAATGGSLTYTAADKTITWTAPGDSAGTPVVVDGGGWFKVNSATAGMAIYLTLYGSNAPVANKTDSLSLSGLSPSMSDNTHTSIPGHFNAMNGRPFGDKQYWICGESYTAEQILHANCLAVWRDIYSAITYIDLGTNGILSKSSADSTLVTLQNIINYRKAVGSRVIVKTIHLAHNVPNSTGDDTRMAKSYFNRRLAILADSMGFELLDINRYFVDRLSGSLRTPLFSAMLNSDLVHLSGQGAYIGAKKVLAPSISKYYPERSPTPSGLISYDSAKCPTGNLTTYGLFKGTGGNKNGIITAGDLSDGFIALRVAGTTITATGTMPQSGAPIARTDGVPGYWAEFAVNNTNPGHASGEALRIALSAYVSGSNYAAGDKIRLVGEAEVEYVSGAGIWGLVAFLALSGGGRTYALNMGGSSAVAAPLGNCNGEIIKYKFSSPPLTILAGATNLVMNLDMYMMDNSQAKFRFSQDLRIEKVL